MTRQASDLEGADAWLKDMDAQAVIADNRHAACVCDVGRSTAKANVRHATGQVCALQPIPIRSTRLPLDS
ncbi:MAG: hypothetical protein LBQ32_02950 [Burkholderiaceae bacterium]|jgi:hypothetical protein|nr:hypothetical protein [Burkholderiaceae bacterium]